MDSLRVFWDRQPLGELMRDEGEINLTYAPSWTEKTGAVPVSPHIPFSSSSEKERQASVHRFLTNLLPEGPFLEELSRTTGCSKFNIFGLIAAIGTETTGALSFSVPEKTERPRTSFREIPLPELEERIAIRKERSILMWDGKPRLSVAGVQDKLPVMLRRDGVMGFGEGDLCSTHILKFGKNPAQHLVVNEYLCMRLARAVGLPTAEVQLLRIGEPVLAVQRFDRRWEGDRVARLHLIDGCQLLDLPPIFKYERPYGKGRDVAGIRDGASLRLLYENLHLCVVPAAAMHTLLNWAFFQLIIGNGDAHGKNISFFVKEGGLEVAPAYDLICMDPYDSYERDLAMAIGDCFDPDDIAPYQLADMCEDCKVPRKAAARALESLCKKTLQTMGILELPGLTSGEQDFAREIRTRIAENAMRLQKMAPEIPRITL